MSDSPATGSIRFGLFVDDREFRRAMRQAREEMKTTAEDGKRLSDTIFVTLRPAASLRDVFKGLGKSIQEAFAGGSGGGGGLLETGLKLGAVVNGITGGFKLLTAAVQGARGDSEAMWKALSSLPLGIGAAISAMKEFGDLVSGAADDAERMRRNLEKRKAKEEGEAAGYSFDVRTERARSGEIDQARIDAREQRRAELEEIQKIYDKDVAGARKAGDLTEAYNAMKRREREAEITYRDTLSKLDDEESKRKLDAIEKEKQANEEKNRKIEERWRGIRDAVKKQQDEQREAERNLFNLQIERAAAAMKAARERALGPKKAAEVFSGGQSVGIEDLNSRISAATAAGDTARAEKAAATQERIREIASQQLAKLDRIAMLLAQGRVIEANQVATLSE